jgi:splicing factor U2AF subunit
MAEHLASIFGTEKDRVNCPFYFKIGACRHGDRCSRMHNRPTISPTLLFSNMYQRPDMAISGTDPHAQNMDPRKLQEHFEDFYEDLFEELSKYGELESLNVCDNLADHMVGNVYVLFKEEEQAATALRALQGRFYAGRPIFVDFSPVTDFREATCRQYEENTCNRGGYCNFMHLKKISRDLRKKLFGASKRHSHSRSPSRSRSRSLSPRHRDFDYRNRGYDHRHREGSRYNGRHDDYSRRDSGRSRRRYSRSRSRSRSPAGRRKESSRREDSVERRAKIEQWNTEREKLQPTGAGNITSNSTGDGDSAYEDHHGR